MATEESLCETCNILKEMSHPIPDRWENVIVITENPDVKPVSSALEPLTELGELETLTELKDPEAVVAIVFLKEGHDETVSGLLERIDELPNLMGHVIGPIKPDVKLKPGWRFLHHHHPRN